MIKFKAGDPPKQIVGFGLTEKNVEQIKAGHPIHVMGVELSIPFDVMIFYGKDEREIADMFRQEGLIDPERTVLHDTTDKPRRRN